ncbi:phosphate regulon transcriptional regulator PhoB [Inhella gelatinilytica]|uniref:Phosphate regulon transcriptional regulatory protein PhoB n=1 Tax=Inhella gelatinilytica TaxID=2795030 RepID=A0A931IXQ8_9BURK|nr:phosphate regulon transcriptional regulator PhoB [Inhella gelatinilytica]MBH9554109.1 phosphate regulon transcriptional regulator PhoB [Inhella gelatinilytica]
MARILIVEDESAIAELIALNLRHDHHEVQSVAHAEAAQQAIEGRLPDAVILDWMLPGASGVQLLRRWRSDARTRQLPVILLTARAQETDKILGLDAGADDYLTKPFSPGELLARMRALLRRRAPESLSAPLRQGPLELDPVQMRVRAGEQEVNLGPTEFRLLKFLMSHPGRVHSRSQLLDRVWGDHVAIEERTVDVHIKRLRDALEPAQTQDWIETVRGAGYRFRESPVAS